MCHSSMGSTTCRQLIWSQIFHSQTFESMKMDGSGWFLTSLLQIFPMTPTNNWGIWTKPWRYLLLLETFVPALPELFRPWESIGIMVYQPPKSEGENKQSPRFMRWCWCSTFGKGLVDWKGRLIVSQFHRCCCERQVEQTTEVTSPPGIATSTNFAHPQEVTRWFQQGTFVDFQNFQWQKVAIFPGCQIHMAFRTEMANLCHSPE